MKINKEIKNLWMSRIDYGKPKDNLDDWYFQSCFGGKAFIMVYKDIEIRHRYELVMIKVEELWRKMLICLDKKLDPYDCGFIKLVK